MTHWQRAVVVLVLGFGVIDYAAADMDVQLGLESFRWREFLNGSRLLKETGPRVRATFEWSRDVGHDPLFVEARGSLYGGNIHYDGQTQVGTPFQTDANYFGLQGEGLVGNRFGANRNVELFGGGGIDSWRRDIKGRDNVIGAIEDWTVFYLSFGTGYYISQASVRYRVRAGGKYPIYTTNMPDIEDVTLEPKGKLSLFARLTADFLDNDRPRWGVGLYYDTYRFAASNTVTVVTQTSRVTIFQPESRQEVIGIYGAFYF
jgi:hypothetical protein